MTLVNLKKCENGFSLQEEESRDRQISQLDETLKGFVSGNSVNVTVLEVENFEHLINVQSKDLERADDSVRQRQVIERKLDDQITRAVGCAHMIVKNCMHDAILTAIDNFVIPSVEMAVKSITGSARHGTSSEVQNPDRRYFVGNIRDTPLMSASRRLDLDIDLNKNDETRNDEVFDDFLQKNAIIT